MFAVYAEEANFEDPLACVVIGERPDPIVKAGWVRVKVTHAYRSLFTKSRLIPGQTPFGAGRLGRHVDPLPRCVDAVVDNVGAAT